MATKITMPKFGLNMTEGLLAEWLVDNGEEVEEGQAIFTVETEKTTQDVEAQESGILKHSAEEGSTIPVGELLAYILQPGEEMPEEGAAPKEKEKASKKKEGQKEKKEGKKSEPEKKKQKAASEGGRALASPAVRKKAKEQGIDLKQVPASGKAGQVTLEDLETYSKEAAPAVRKAPAEKKAPVKETIPFSGIRKTIADNMHQSLQETASVTLTTELDAGAFISLRFTLNRDAGRELKISYNDLLLKICAQALDEHRYVNASLEDGTIRRKDEINIGIAVDTDRGLMAPVVKGCDKLSVREIAEKARELEKKAKSGKIDIEDLEGGTFTVTNLGPYDIDYFTPVIYLPQAAILGVGRIMEKPVAYKGAVVVRPVMTLSLTFDHRLVDGAPAAEFLKKVKDLIEKANLQE